MKLGQNTCQATIWKKKFHMISKTDQVLRASKKASLQYTITCPSNTARSDRTSTNLLPGWKLLRCRATTLPTTTSSSNTTMHLSTHTCNSMKNNQEILLYFYFFYKFLILCYLAIYIYFKTINFTYKLYRYFNCTILKLKFCKRNLVNSKLCTSKKYLDTFHSYLYSTLNK